MDMITVAQGDVASGELLFTVPPDTVTDDQLAYGRMAYIVDGIPLGWWAPRQ